MKHLTLAIIVVLTAVSSVNAEHHHLPWMKYFAGTWKSSGGGPGAEWQIELVAKDACGIGKMKDADGEESAWIIGWDAAKECLIHEWFTDKGSHGCVSYKIVDENTLRGPLVVTASDGETKAIVTVKKLTDNRFTVHWTRVTTNGQEADDINIVVEK